jgi:hypothetical protein
MVSRSARSDQQATIALAVPFLATFFWFGFEALLHYNIGHAGGDHADATATDPGTATTSTAAVVTLWQPWTWALPHQQEAMSLAVSIVACAALSRLTAGMLRNSHSGADRNGSNGSNGSNDSMLESAATAFWFVLEALLHYQIGRGCGSGGTTTTTTTNASCWNVAAWESPSGGDWLKIIVSVAACTWLSHTSTHYLLAHLHGGTARGEGETQQQEEEEEGDEVDDGEGEEGGGEEEEELPTRKELPLNVLGLMVSPPKSKQAKKATSTKKKKKSTSRKTTRSRSSGKAKTKTKTKQKQATVKSPAPTARRRSSRIRNRAK